MIQTAQLDGDQGNGILHQPQIQQKGLLASQDILEISIIICILRPQK